MGQQQLLLIVLGVIVVGIAVVVGINLFQSSAESSAQDSIVSQGTNLGALAQQYFKKPSEMGGGGNSYVGFSIPTGLDSTADAVWSISTAGTASKIVFTGTPLDASYGWTVEVTVDSTIRSVVK